MEIQRLKAGLLRRLRHVAPRTWVLLAIVVSALSISTGLVAFAPEPDRVPAERNAVPVAGLIAELGTYSPQANLYGRVETPRTASLTALVSDTVAELLVREGDRVQAGDVLVQLDQTDAELEVQRREAERVQARADLAALELAGGADQEVLEHQRTLHELAQGKVERYRQLREQGSISQETLNAVLQDSHAQAIALSRQRNQVQSFEHRLAQAKASVSRAETALEEARVTLQRTSIRAPFPGRVTSIQVAPGELVSPGRVVAEMYDDSALEIRVQIPNAHLPGLQAALASGVKPNVSVDLGDRLARGELDRLVGAVAKGQSGVDGLVRLNAGTPLDLGRAVNLRITLPPVTNAVAIPVQAVYGQRRLFVIENGLLRGVDIERLGATTDASGTRQLLVRADELQDGVRILTSQLSNAVTGLRVSVGGEEGEPASASEESTTEAT